MVDDKISAVGFVGQGRMGLAMAKHVMAAGYPVFGYDINAEAMGTAVEAGVNPASSARQVAENSDLICVIVPSDDDVRQACDGADGVFAGAKNGSIVALCSSLMPETVSEMAAAAPEGVDILDLPSARGPIAADQGRLALLVGGEQEVLQRAQPVLETFGEAIHYLGPLGAGQIAKTANNILLWCNMQTSLEVLSLTRSLGLDPEAIREAMYDCSGDSWALRQLDRINPAWPVKDMINAMELAASVGEKMPMSQLMKDMAGQLSQEAANKILFGEEA
ncbi:MAG: NAD(P)-dependent oxidoreductase [Rhodospirillaceae bacterium]|nr:NAD(P)-dependent oxidoreductase [Rhodospirillaceae bacterium]